MLLARGYTVGILPANHFNRSIVMLGNTTWSHKVYHLRWVVLARWEGGEILDSDPPPPHLAPSGVVAGLI